MLTFVSVLLLHAAADGPASDALHIGIPRQAGTIEQVHAGDPSACTTLGTTRRCPGGSQSMRWHGGPAYALVHWGDGRAFVLAADGSQSDATARLQALRSDAGIDRHELLELRRTVVFTSDWTPPWPTEALLRAHLALLDHPDHRVRREAVEGLHPWLAGTVFDPLPTDSPIPLDESDLRALAADPDPGVRKRVARILREARPAMPRSLVAELLLELLDDAHGGVRRAAVVALPDAVDRDVLSAEQAWSLLVQMVPQQIPAGRAACNQLARMKGRLERADVQVDVRPALERVLEHHPERGWRVWSAFRQELPIEEAWMRRLLEDTVGLDKPLIVHWQAQAPDLLDRVLADWEPARHPERRELLEALRAHDDSLSAPPQAPQAP